MYGKKNITQLFLIFIFILWLKLLEDLFKKSFKIKDVVLTCSTAR